MGDFDAIPVDEPIDVGEPIYRALVVGIDAYDEATLTMQFCSEPAARMAELLRSRGYMVRELHDEPDSHGRPTLEAVERELAAIMKVSDENDTVLFYFAGHGTQVKDRPILLMADARSKGDRYPKGALTVSQLLARLRGRPRFTVVLLDACRMGLTLDPGCSKSTVMVREKTGGFALLSGSTSDDVTQDAISAAGSGGAFTLALLQGLSGAAADEQGGVRFSALARYVQDWIERWKATDDARMIGANQKPVLRLEVADVQIVPRHNDLRDLTPPTSARITRAAFSYDGRCLATAGEDRALRIWDARTCTQIFPAIEHDSEIVDITFSAKSTEVCTLARNGVTRIWSVRDASEFEVERLRKRPAIHAAAVSGDGLSRAVATANGIYIDAIDGIVPVGTRKLGRKKVCYWSVAYASEFELVSGDDSGRVCLWDEIAETVTSEFRHEGPVTVVASSHQRRCVAAGGTDPVPSATLKNQPRIWDLDSGEAVLLRGHRAAATAIVFSPDDAWIATASLDGTVRLFDSRTGTLGKTFSMAPIGRRTPPEAHAVGFSHGGEYLFAGYSDGRGRRFQLT